MQQCVPLSPVRRVRRALGALALGGMLAVVALVMSPVAAAAQDAAPGQRVREDLVAKVAGKKIHKDKATGQVRAITVEEARDLIASIVALTSRTSDLPVVTRADGAGMMALDGHADHVVISRYNPDGSVSVRCIASADEAADFLAEEPLEVQ